MKGRIWVFGLLLTAFCLFAIDGFSTITRATSDGNWSSGGTWTNGVPSCGDTVIIDTGVTVTVTSHVNLDESSACSTALHIEIYGILQFNTGRKMYLPCNSFVSVSGSGSLDKGSGGGNSNVIDICETTVWNAGSGSQGGPTSFGTGTPLPITLLEFSVHSKGDMAVAEWITLSEINNDYFTLEKSLNGIDFEIAGTMDGAGNSNQELSYRLIDDNPYDGTSYYRLKQTDFNGEFSYSKLTVVTFNAGSQSELLIYPNPSNGEFNMKANGIDFNRSTILISDLAGKVVYKGAKNTSINLETKQGVYLVYMLDEWGQCVAKQKLVIAK